MINLSKANKENYMNQSKEMAKLVIAALEDKKAEDISIIDISHVSVLADYFIIASGNNKSQVQAMTDSVDDVLGRAGYVNRKVEGYNTANWILMDYKDIIVHVFDKENRMFYDLERIWRDGKKVEIDALDE
jgi:ribosome-associated protein